ncbi:MAG: DUF1735 domain-containing protein [Bacteroidota bacterium]|nr:DUF1735 domain-containing protein [Bacteroidota bacterium]
MKKIHSIYLLILAVFFLSSCEKGIDTIEVDSTVYLTQSGLTVQTLPLGESDFVLGVYKAGLNQTNPTVTVKMDVDTVAGNAFIAQNPGYVMLPSSFYTIPSQTVVIPKGQEREYFNIHMKGIDESFVNEMYILPISIQSVDANAQINDDKKVAILQFSRFRNNYEASYKAYGTAVLAGTESDGKILLDDVVTGTTVDANTIKIQGNFGGMLPSQEVMNLNVSVQNGQVQVIQAPGDAKNYNVRATTGKTSTYTGTYNSTYKCNQGVYELYYTYTTGGIDMDVAVEYKFWL